MRFRTGAGFAVNFLEGGERLAYVGKHWTSDPITPIMTTARRSISVICVYITAIRGGDGIHSKGGGNLIFLSLILKAQLDHLAPKSTVVHGNNTRFKFRFLCPSIWPSPLTRPSAGADQSPKIDLDLTLIGKSYLKNLWREMNSVNSCKWVDASWECVRYHEATSGWCTTTRSNSPRTSRQQKPDVNSTHR